MSFNAWPIKDVRDGSVGWVQGRVVGTPPLVAPLSKRPCFHHARIVDGVAAESATADELTIDDGTGIAIVVMKGAVIQLDHDHEQRVFTAAAPWAGAERPDVLHREGILGPGELVAVYGTCHWERDPDPSRARLYRDPLPMRLRVTSTARVRVWISEDVASRRDG